MIDVSAVYIIRLLLGYIFITSALYKITHKAVFYRELNAYQVVPALFLPGTVIFLPVLELYSGLGLLMLSWQSPPLLACALLLTYSIGMAINLLRGRHELDCGCHGAFHNNRSHRISWWLVLRNLFLIGLIFLTLKLELSSQVITASHILFIAVASLCLIALYETSQRFLFKKSVR